MMRTHSRSLLLIFAALTAVPVAGCATLPSLAPFEEHTGKMVSGINTGYTLSQISLATASPKQAKQLADAWKPTAAALRTMVAYSQALSSLAAQGAKGSEAAGALAGALDGLVNAVGQAGIPAQFANAFQAINQHIAVVRARNDLAEAVGAAQPAVDLLLDVLAAQMQALASLHEEATIGMLINHRADNTRMVDYIEAVQNAENRVLDILRQILDYKALGDAGLASVNKQDSHYGAAVLYCVPCRTTGR